MSMPVWDGGGAAPAAASFAWPPARANAGTDPGIAGGDKKKAWALADEIGRIDAARGFLAQATLARKEKNSPKQNEFYQKALASAPHDARVLQAAAAFYASDSDKNTTLP